ncbi:MAG: UDP-N-acetylenolpyruvoylglucosamine reductase [Firmicutes bacterium ADurb.Bin182]|nr:MAG: UDP-N-acetylenolpyruvoylglucosamine reductase [Firmicutes bacterium ADurb.Bin182]
MYDANLLCDRLRELNIERNAPMRSYTTFRIGGNADVMLHPGSSSDIIKAITEALACGAPYHVIGNGSNLLVRDGGIRALVIRIGEDMAGIEQDGPVFRVGAGCLLSSFAKETINRGFMGMEWATGIPGTVGGAVAMNAGAYGGEIKQVLKSVNAVVDLKQADLTVNDADMGYRRSAFSAPGCIVCSAVFELKPDDGHAADREAEYRLRRRAKQPLSYPSAGSVFKRPAGYFAGSLIENAGLKGTRIGDAEVSELHAGFIINRGKASAKDVLSLIELVKIAVREHSGVTLEPEIVILGEDA